MSIRCQQFPLMTSARGFGGISGGTNGAGQGSCETWLWAGSSSSDRQRKRPYHTAFPRKVCEKIFSAPPETPWICLSARLGGNCCTLNYLLGFWYLNEHTNRFEVFDINADKNIDGSDRYRQINETDSCAGFGRIDWLLTGNVTPDFDGLLINFLPTVMRS